MAEMEIARNDMVMGPGGTEVGRIAHVILDGTSERVTDLVIARPDGSEFTVPIATVRQAGPGVFMMGTAPEKIASEHPFEASGYREVEERGSQGDRVIVPSHSTPGTFSTSAGAINQYTPRRDTPIPASPPASGSHMTPLTPGIHMPPAPAQSSPPPVSPVMRFEHAPPPTTRAATGASAGSQSQAGAMGHQTPEANISATRAPMTPKVDAPHEKAAPTASLKEQVVGAVHEQVSAVKTQVTDAVHEQVAATKGQIHDMTAGQAATTASHARDNAQGAAGNVVEMIRANPLPAALLGLGVGWLWKEHRQKGATGTASHTYRYDSPAQGRASQYQDTARTSQSDDSSLADKVGDAAGHVKDAVGSAAGQTQERASQLAGQTGETVGNFVGAAQEHVGDLTSNVRDTAGGFGSGVVEMVRANPIPAALTGLSIGWILLNRSQGNGNGNTSINRGMSSSTSTSSMRKQGARSGQGQSEGSAIDALGDAASTAKSKAGQLVGQAGDSVSTIAESAQDRARDVSDTVQYKALEAQSWVGRVLHENPMNIGMVALSLGIAAGFVLPQTPTEDRLFGEARDALMGKTTETIQKSQTLVQDLQKVVEDMQDLPTAR